MFQLICMSFDGEYVTEGDDFPTIAAAWQRADDMGSRWFFYPFCFVVTVSGKTIADAPSPLHGAVRKRVSSVRRLFAHLAATPAMQDADCDKFSFAAGDALLFGQ